ncbi:MAG: glycosyltransferase family 4 protein [Akkermansia sp.]|nr:glycosyltransferase family 4 protein [Akkermansia sp.]
MAKKILILANHYNTLRIFRRELLEELHRLGNVLVVSIPPCDEENKSILKGYGCRIIETKEMDRRGMNPIRDMKLLLRYRQILAAEHPDICIAYTIKPNIYGGLACRMAGVPFFANVTGLGSAFQPGHEKVRLLVTALYKLSLKKAKRVFFENAGNLETLVNAKVVRESQAILMPGAGVNLQEFSPAPYPDSDKEIRFLFVGRIMQEKGVNELFAAIRHLKPRYPQTRFDFIGWYEDAYQTEVEQMQKEGLIHFHGFQPEVRPYIERCHCVILPSWHEGMSNTLLEAAAMARPLITNRIHGCMEAVKENVSGFLCKKQNISDLIDAIERFINLPLYDKQQMGTSARTYIANNFDKKNVVAKTISKVLQY